MQFSCKIVKTKTNKNDKVMFSKSKSSTGFFLKNRYTVKLNANVFNF